LDQNNCLAIMRRGDALFVDSGHAHTVCTINGEGSLSVLPGSAIYMESKFPLEVYLISLFILSASYRYDAGHWT
jgi:pantothenate kinase type III